MRVEASDSQRQKKKKERKKKKESKRTGLRTIEVEMDKVTAAEGKRPWWKKILIWVNSCGMVVETGRTYRQKRNTLEEEDDDVGEQREFLPSLPSRPSSRESCCDRRGKLPSSSRVPDRRTNLCFSSELFLPFKSTKRDWFVYRAKHCACVATGKRNGKRFRVHLADDPKHRKRKYRVDKRTIRIFLICIYLWRLSFRRRFGGHAFPKDCVQYFFVRLRRRSRERAFSPWFSRTVTRLVS